MKIIEIVTDWLANTNLMEMAFQRKQIVDKCINLAHQIDLHLIKCIWFSDAIEVNHWCNELNAWLRDIQNMKFNRRLRLSGDQYYQYLFIGYLQYGVSDMMELCDAMVDVEKIDMSANNGLTQYQVYEKLEKVLHAVCYDIAKGTFKDIKTYL